MMNCPDCNFENIEGTDVCEQCGQPLCVLSKPQASSKLEKQISKDRIRQLPPRESLIVLSETSVSEVIKLLYSNKVGCAVIVDKDQNMLGIFSERDVLMRLGPEAATLGDRPISEFMTPKPEFLEARDKIVFAIQKMDLGGYRHIPITDGKKVCSVISVRDILKYITALIPSA